MTAPPACGRYSRQKKQWEVFNFLYFRNLLVALCVHCLLPSILCEPDWRPRPFNASLPRQPYNTRPELPFTPNGHHTRVQQNRWKELNRSLPYKAESSFTQYEQRVQLTDLNGQRVYETQSFEDKKIEQEGYQRIQKEMDSLRSYQPQQFTEYGPTNQQSVKDDSHPHISHLHFNQHDQKGHQSSLKEMGNPHQYNAQSHLRSQKGYHSFENTLEVEALDSQLLVGFSHDPYRNSLMSKDFENGPHHTTEALTSKPRDKRGVLHLYNMISCATGCDPIKYKGYGCYCGFLGEGRPLDGIDQCCAIHDKCYENLFCPLYTVYFQPYYWTCYRGKPLCALENYSTRNQFVNGCAANLCECDRRLAMCLRQYRCPKRTAFCTSSPLRLLQNLIMIT